MRLFFVVLMTMAGLILNAQENLVVQILDLGNQPVVDVEVQLTNPGRGLSWSATTGLDGRVVFRAIPALEGYRVQVPATEGYLETTSGDFNIRSNESKVLELVLAEERRIELEAVEVVARPATRINRRDAEVAFELRPAELEALPIEGRDITRVLYRLPNVSQATGFYPEAPNVSINGANSLFTSYLIDGMDNNERFLGGQKFAIPSGFVRNITVLTNNYSAEYGLTGNGVVNVTTPSGGNEWSGEAFVLTRPGAVIDGRADFPQRDLSGNLVKEGFQRYQTGVALGGPIRKDKTFLYFNAEHTTDLKDNLLFSPTLNVADTVRGNNQFQYFSAKIDQRWSDRFQSSLRANLGLVEIERQGGGLEGGVLFPSAANTQDRNSFLLVSRNTYIGERFTAQTNLQYARFRWNYARPQNPGSPQTTVLSPSEEVIAILGHPGYAFDQTENTFQLQQKFNFYWKKHTLKTGFGLITASHQLFGGGNPNGNYRVKLSQEQLDAVIETGNGADLLPEDIPSGAAVLAYDVELRPASFGARQTIVSLYAEDQWTATSRLNLVLGLRYDYDNLSKGGSSRGDYNNLAPRLNFNYKIGARQAIRGGYGLFYEKVPYAIYSDALQQNTTSPHYRRQLQALIDQGILPAGADLDAITFEGNLTASVANVAYLQGPNAQDLSGQRETAFSNERRILNPEGYQNPLTHQFTLGYQLQMGEQTLFYADLVHNRSYQLFRLRNLNAAAPYPLNDPGNAVVRTVAAADLTRPIPIYDASFAVIGGDTLTGVARNVIVSESGGRSRYYAATFNLQRDRGEGWFSYRINYTLSLLENNTEDINFRAMDGNDFDSEWGPSINDRRHLINGIANFHPLKNLTLTLATLLQSGQPINRIPDALVYGTTDLNGDGSFFGDAYVGNSDRYPGESRNSDRLPWSEVVDLAIQYDWKIGENTLELRADIFNVLNVKNLSGYANNATQSNQIQVGQSGSPIVERNAGAPRQFQFGVRFLF